ncbi:MAG: T9SS C-terminal target domain-containing protein, partial [Bacteroidota bacterium]
MTKFLVLISFFACWSAKAQIVNAYAKVSSISGTTFTVTNVNESNHTFAVGNKIIIMQMQDDVIGANTTDASTFGDLSTISSAGLYEIGIISSRLPATGTPTSITVSSALANAYHTGTNSSLQIISFRNMGSNYTTSAAITGLAWDGNVGGVIAFEVTNTLTLNHPISADVIGFRKGLINTNATAGSCLPTLFRTSANSEAFKGEGIYKSTDVNYTNARGKILSGGGGGNQHNAGGGGGGNYSKGGDGGFGYSCGSGANASGGFGGIALNSYIASNRIFMGGGGGGGQQNNTVGLDGG